MESLFSRRLHCLAVGGAAIYALFLILAPFEHHDIACHLKTPQHCTSCSSGIVGCDPSAPVCVGAYGLPDAGRASGEQLLAEDALLPVRSTGRSPPARA